MERGYDSNLEVSSLKGPNRMKVIADRHMSGRTFDVGD